MATSKSGNKSIRQAEARRVFNMRRLRTMKSTIKEVVDLVSGKNKSDSKETLSKAYKTIDKAAKRGILKKNTAARRKSKLARGVAGIK